MTNEEYIKRAKSYFHHEGDIEVDDNAIVSRGGDPGAYVEAWVWVDNDSVLDGDDDAEQIASEDEPDAVADAATCPLKWCPQRRIEQGQRRPELVEQHLKEHQYYMTYGYLWARYREALEKDEPISGADMVDSVAKLYAVNKEIEAALDAHLEATNPPKEE